MGNNRPGSSPSFVLVDFGWKIHRGMSLLRSAVFWRKCGAWYLRYEDPPKNEPSLFGLSYYQRLQLYLEPANMIPQISADRPKYFVWTNKIHVPNHQPVVRWVYHMFIHWFFDAIGASSSVRSESSSLTLGTYRIAACLWSSPGKRLTGASASHLKQNAKEIGDHHSK